MRKCLQLLFSSNAKTIRRFSFVWLLGLVTSAMHVVGVLGAEQPGKQLADQLVAAGLQGGLIVHLDCGDGRQTGQLLLDDRFLVQGLERDPADVTAAREHLRTLGLYGRVTVRHYDGRELPYAETQLTRSCQTSPTEVAGKELMRVLAPRGVALVDG